MSALESCVQILEISNATLADSLSSLSQALNDYPRSIRVLETSRQYELVSEDEILQAKLDIQREVEPQIRELILRAESGLQGLQRKERTMHTQVEELRTAPPVLSRAPMPKKPTSSVSSTEVAKMKARLMALQTQKEALLKAADKAQEDLRNKQSLLKAK